MKLNSFSSKNGRRGIAMTEYLIILAIVAIAAIATVGLFGKQVQSNFDRNVQALAGTAKGPDTSIGTKATSSVKEADLGNYTDAASVD